jgi:hypothetical protein
MKKAVLVALGLAAGAVIYVLLADNSQRDIWEDVQKDFD